MTARELRVFPNAAQLAEAVTATLVKVIDECLLSQNRVDVALTGGTLGSAVTSRLITTISAYQVDWSQVHLWWGDERWVDLDSHDRNDRELAQAATTWGARGPVVHQVTPPVSGGSVHIAADTYSHEINGAREASGHTPFFAVVLLGIGPDGHVASLFPGHKGLNSLETCIGIDDSPKPPPIRVSLTFASINDSQRVWLLASGGEKHAALDQLFPEKVGQAGIPAAMVHGKESTIVWADQAAVRGDSGR